MLCATSPSPERNPPQQVYLSLFNIYAYLNLIFKDKKEQKGALVSWVLAATSEFHSPACSREKISCPPVPWTGRWIGKYHVLISVHAPWPDCGGHWDEPQ